MNKTVYVNKSEVDQYMAGYRQGIYDQSIGVNQFSDIVSTTSVFASGYADGYVGENCTIYISKDR